MLEGARQLRRLPEVGAVAETGHGFYKLQSVKNTSLYLTGVSDGAPLSLQNAVTDGSQDWKLVP